MFNYIVGQKQTLEHADAAVFDVCVCLFFKRTTQKEFFSFYSLWPDWLFAMNYYLYIPINKHRDLIQT